MIGVIIIDKPKNISSSGVVVKIKKLLNEKTVGHLGTLDPLASGVLPVCIGKATRLFDYFLKKKKTYVAQFAFGMETDTLDLEGQTKKSCEYIPTEKELKEAIKQKFIGKILQKPPDFSSKKIDGQKAYDLARKGEKVELSSKEIEIFDFVLEREIDEKTFEFRITCSAGTYIRSIARDLAYSVNSCATMTNLVRTKAGDFCLENSVKLEDLTKEKIEANLISIETILSDFEKIEITKDQFQKLRNGIKIEVIWVKNSHKDICIVFENKIIGVGRIENERLIVQTYFI